MLTALLSAMIAGILTYFVAKTALLTFSFLKKRIIEKLRSKPGSIDEVGVIPIRTILDQAPTIDFSAFGNEITEDDILLVGVKKDGDIDLEVDDIQAVSIDDRLAKTLEQSGGAIKIGGLTG